MEYLVRATYDALLHRVILFGGQDNNGYFNDAWELIPESFVCFGSDWRNASPVCAWLSKIMTLSSRLLFLAQFLESRIGAQGVPERIEIKNSRRDRRGAINPTTIVRV